MVSITNSEIADIFHNMSLLLEVKGDSVFKIRAYQRAASTVENLSSSLYTLVEKQEDLRSISGIGKAINDKIYEYVNTGHIATYESLLAELPEGVLTLLAVPQIGPKTAYLIAQELNISSLDELEQAILNDRLSQIEGIGPKTCQTILNNLKAMRTKDTRIPIGIALSTAESIVKKLDEICSGQAELHIAGSLRRWEETIGDIDIIAVCEDHQTLFNGFVALEEVSEVLLQGDKKASVLLYSGVQVDLRISDKTSLGAMLQYFTGSQQHNIKLREHANRQNASINEYGVTNRETGVTEIFSDERSLYQSLGLTYIPPELRVGLEEVSYSLDGDPYNLVQLSDIKGDLHIHTDWSDGSDSMEDMVQAAVDYGCEYIAITDHSAGLGIAHGLSVERLRDHNAKIKQLQEKVGIRIFTGAEVDIRADGKLDYPDVVLRELDVVVASIHSAMGQDSETMTRRLIDAINHESVTMIGHLTTRIIGQRPPIEFDLEHVLKEAKLTGTALEINAAPERLDLKDSHASLARQIGVPLVINTDSHNISGFRNRRYGIGLARRAGCRARNVLNSMPVDQFTEYITAPKSDRSVIFNYYCNAVE